MCIYLLAVILLDPITNDLGDPSNLQIVLTT